MQGSQLVALNWPCKSANIMQSEIVFCREISWLFVIVPVTSKKLQILYVIQPKSQPSTRISYRWFLLSMFISIVFIQIVATDASIISILAVNGGITLNYRNLKQTLFLNWDRSIIRHIYSTAYFKQWILLCIKVIWTHT